MLRRGTTLWLAVWCWGLVGIAAAQDTLYLEPSLLSISQVGAGARAAGKSYAFIGAADDATAASHNPAGLAQLERPEVSVVGSFLYRVEDGDADLDNQTMDKWSLDFLSGVFPFQLLGKKVVASLQVQRSFELKDKINFTTIAGDEILDLRSRRTGNLYSISPAIAVQVLPSLSVGAAFNIWPDWFDNGWKTETNLRISGMRLRRSKSEFDFEGFNITAGFLWKMTPVFTLGGVFRSPFDATVRHRNEQAGENALEPFTETLTMEMPLSYGLGLTARVSDLLSLSLDATWVRWSDFRLEEPASSVAAPEVAIIVAPDFRYPARGDTTSVRFGAEYLWLRPDTIVVPLRAGVFYDPEPSYEGRSDFFGFSLGAGVVVKRFLFDIAYTFRTGTRTKLVVSHPDDDTEEIEATIYEHAILTSLIVHL